MVLQATVRNKLCKLRSAQSSMPHSARPQFPPGLDPKADLGAIWRRLKVPSPAQTGQQRPPLLRPQDCGKSFGHWLASMTAALSKLSRVRTDRRSAAIASVSILLALPGGLGQAQRLCPRKGTASGQVAAVDERLDLTLADGTRLKIAGIDPVRPTPDAPERDLQARENLADWLLGRDVEIRRLEAGRDRWGRTVAMVFAPAVEGMDVTQALQMQMAPLLPVGEAILDAGLARYEADIPNDPCRSAMLGAEARARASGLGLWADPYYSVLVPGSRQPLAEKAGSTVILEGNVTVVRIRKPRITLYFGQRKGSDFSVAIGPLKSKEFEAAKPRLADLAGQTVRARGLLDLRLGPQVEASTLDAVEVLGPQTAAATPGAPK
jgi:endonuclease YncB( thermonuclease family)